MRWYNSANKMSTKSDNRVNFLYARRIILHVTHTHLRLKGSLISTDKEILIFNDCNEEDRKKGEKEKEVRMSGDNERERRKKKQK